MTAALDANQRSRLERLVTRARRILESDLLDRASGRFGIDPDGTVAEEDALRLDPTALAQRRELVDVIDHLRSEGDDLPGAVSRLLREATFTHLNRLVAIRIAEALRLLPPSLAHGRSSQGFRDILEVVPSLAGDETGGYWAYLALCGDELAGDVPALFDPRNPLLALTPSPGAIDDLVELLASQDSAELWLAPDCLGWVYQFFNTNDERRLMRESSAAPRDSWELAVRNQFFTPRYVVDFLVQNTLGRRLVDADAASPLLDELPLLIDDATHAREPVSLADLSMLDPACGSGHFLLAGYDVLERAWHHAGVTAAEAAPAIVRSLWGIDIDPRCAQVAAAAIVFRARRSCPDGELPRPNIICARALPATSTGLESVLAGLPAGQQRLVEAITDAMSDAPILGSLLKIEHKLATEVRDAVFAGASVPGSLFDELPAEALQSLEDDLLAALSRVADATTSNPAERLLAAEADDAIRFVNALQRRHDVVLMNPPYGAGANGTTEYLHRTYPGSWTELYACFVERGLDLLRPYGRLGALTSSQFLSTKRLGSLREHLASEAHLAALIDLGPGVLDGATVNTAMFVVEKKRSDELTYYADLARTSPDERAQLSLDPKRPAEVRSVTAFRSIPGTPFAFHLPEAIVDLWAASDRLEPSLAKVRTGCKSFDDARYVRAHWEVGPRGLASGWRRYLKGGEYQPYFAPSHLVLNWRDDGADLRGEGERSGRLAQVLQSSRFWGQPGICYPRMSSIGFAARAMQEGEIFADQSIAVLPNKGVEILPLLGLLNATVTAEILQTFGRGRATENGSVKSLPFGRQFLKQLHDLADPTTELITLFAEKERTDETSTVFLRPESLNSPEFVEDRRRLVLDLATALQTQVDQRVAKALGVSGRIDPDMPSRITLLTRTLRSPSTASTDWARALISYLVGVAFGRWDPAQSDCAVDERVDPLAMIPMSPPGMTKKWLDVRDVLLDEAGHSLDVQAVIEDAREAIGVTSDVLDRCLKILGASTIREYLRRGFFKDHLANYSRSRRRAPIYWSLTVPSGRWGVWTHAPTLTRESLFAITAAAADRVAASELEVRRLRKYRHPNASDRAVTNALEMEEKLADELRRFRDEAERIASLGWEPDFNDGIVLCAAPLADLFPAWKDAAAARKEIRAGKYPWATVSKWADQL